MPQSSQCNRKRQVDEASTKDFEELLGGTLGDWDCNPVLLQLKEGAQPYHGRPFPIPKKHVETLKKENPKTIRLGSFEGASRFLMGVANLHHPKE